MATTSYTDLLRDPKWQKKRLRIFERDDWRCVWCRDTENNLQVHHKIYARGGKPWEVDDSALVTLCQACHGRITDLRRRANAVLGEFSVYELPIVVAMLESMWSDGRRSVSAVHVDRINDERNALLLGPFSKAASRRMEALDAEMEDIWEHLQQASQSGATAP